MHDLCADLRAEYDALAALCETLTPGQWQHPSRFYGWTPWDEIAHLCFFDETGLLAATDADAFAANTRELMAQMAAGREASQIAPLEYAALVWVVVLDLVVWNSLPDGMTWLGAAIIVASGLYLIRRERVVAARRDDGSPAGH